VTTQHPPPPLAAPLQPETEPRQLGFGFLAHPLRASRFANAQPRHHHYLVHTTTPPLRNVPRCRFTRRARNRATAARFRFFDPNPLRASRFANAQPRHHHYPVHTTTPSLRNVPRCRFTRRARNRATAARFRVWGPTPPRLVFRERAAPPPPPPPRTHHHTTLSPFAVSHGAPTSSHDGSVSAF